jgi:hypothetical protein
MTTPHRQAKRLQRRLRSIPIEEVAPRVAAEERDGLWCLVDGELMFVPADGSDCITNWDDPMECGQFMRYVAAHPERVHDSRESAVAFVRARFGENHTPANAGDSNDE